eukprot:3936315-Rhodomonas_salina.1
MAYLSEDMTDDGTKSAGKQRQKLRNRNEKTQRKSKANRQSIKAKTQQTAICKQVRTAHLFPKLAFITPTGRRECCANKQAACETKQASKQEQGEVIPAKGAFGGRNVGRRMGKPHERQNRNDPGLVPSVIETTKL